MKCPECQTDNPENKKFCRKCGADLAYRCPKCGSEVLPGDRFCGDCRHDLRKLQETPLIDHNKPRSYTPKFLAEKILTTRSSIEGERKVVTVLFADVANYTSIAERLDPEEVHQIMDGCFKILMDEIHKYEGTINQFTGDGVMALFGAPVAHEDHAQRACHAALSIQTSLAAYGDELQRLHGIDFRMRIGLNSGPVVVGSIGDDLRMDYTAIGDTTNLASRLESMTKPGTVLVSESVHKIARSFFEFESVGKVSVKGKEALEAYELMRASDVETRIEAAAAKGLTRFLGRKGEIEFLKNAFEKVESGAGQVVGVVGEAGVGKSRLLIEFRNELPKNRYSYLEGQCLHYGGSMAYLPILDILRAYFDIKDDDQELAIKKKIKSKIIRLDERLRSVLPPFHELFSVKVEDESYLQLEPGEKRVRTFEALRDLLFRESDNRPLVLAVDDLHWIDKTSEEFLDYLIGWLANVRIFLILLYRPEYTHPWGSKSYYNKLGVTQLSANTSLELVQAILETDEVLPELREFILGKTAGNPLFVEELTHSLLENGSIQKRNQQYVLTRKAAEIQLPETIQGIIAARIDRIEDSLKRVMQVASVIGKEFAFRILQNILGMREELKSHLLNLQGLEFISEKKLFPELEYIFKHALTQEVAYNSLLLNRRKEIHEKIGNAIEALYPERLEEYYELLAYHYDHSNSPKKAQEYLALANEKAAKLNAMQEAKTFFYTAMKVLDTLPDTAVNRERRISLLTKQWEVFLLLIELSEYYEVLNRYKSIAVDLEKPELLGAFYGKLANCEWSFGLYDQAIETATKALQLCTAGENYEEARFAYGVLLWSHMCKGNYDNVLTLWDAAERLPKQASDPRGYGGISWAYTHLGRWEEAVEMGRKALKAAEEMSNNSLVSFAAWIISIAHTCKGEYDRALEYGELAVQKAPTLADRLWAQGFLAWASCRSGELRKGIETLNKILPAFTAAQFRFGEVGYRLNLGEAYWQSGEYEKASQTLNEALELAEPSGMKYYIGWAHRILGEVCLETDLGHAAPHFEQSIAIFRDLKTQNELALAYAGSGRLQKRYGNIGQAREYLSNALQIFERLGTLIEPDKVKKELAELPKE